MCNYSATLTAFKKLCLIEHENGLKFVQSFKGNIWTEYIREFNHKLIEASRIKIGDQS